MGKKNEELQGIVATVIAAVTSATAKEEPKTEFEARGKFIVSTYYDDGSLQLRHEADTKAEARAWLQRPENLGKTITICKEVVALTTEIPLAEVNEEEGA